MVEVDLFVIVVLDYLFFLEVFDEEVVDGYVFVVDDEVVC